MSQLGVELAGELRNLWPTCVPSLLKDGRYLGIGDEALPALHVPIEEHPDTAFLIGIAGRAPAHNRHSPSVVNSANDPCRTPARRAEMSELPNELLAGQLSTEAQADALAVSGTSPSCVATSIWS